MKLLYIANVMTKINNFCMSSLLAAKKVGFEFHIAANWGYNSDEERLLEEEKYGIKIHQIDFIRTPYNPKNIKAYIQLCKLVKHEKYDVIHCNTPIGGVCGRMVGKKYNVSRIIYQAHGFHFYKGAPLLNWMIYYPIEKWLARYTDTLITINQEDYNLATRKMKMRNNGLVCYVPGVGIDTTKYVLKKDVRDSKRMEFGFSKEDFVLISVGELNKNKNNIIIIKAMKKLSKSNIHYAICGNGEQEKELKNYAKKINLENNVHFLGFRSDVVELYKMADCFVLPSYREGLSRSLMEAMASGLPVVCSSIRGNVDLIDENGGELFEPSDVEDCRRATRHLLEKELKKLGNYNQKKVQDIFSLESVSRIMYEIYQDNE